MDYSKCIQLNDFRRLKQILVGSTMSRGRLIFNQKVNAEDLQIIYNCFRRSMLDGYIPLKKPIGFVIECPEYPQSVNIIARHPAMMESQLQLMENIAKLIIVGDSPIEVMTGLLQGRVKASNLSIKADGKDVRFLDPSAEVCHTINPLRLRLFINENVDYKLMENSYRIINKTMTAYGRENDNRYIPLNVQHSLFDYIRVLPFNRKEIRYTLVGNISEKDMNELWHNFIDIREKR